MNRMAVAAMSIAALLAGCGSDDVAETTPPPPSAPASSAPSSSPSAEQASALEGTWRTSFVSPRDVEATLRKYGLTKYIERFRPLTPIAAPTALVLEIKEGQWNLSGTSKGEPRFQIDFDAEYVVDGNKVDKIHATGVTTFGWSVDGDTLTLKWLETTEPPYKGIPDEVFQRALYMTADFEKQG